MTSSKYHKLAIGTAQFGMEYGIANTKGKVSIEEMKDILSFAKDHSVNMLDTSIGYGDSEKKLGEIGIYGWEVITKLLRIKDDIKDIGGRVEKNIHDSLRRMKIDSVYGILFHNPDQLLHTTGDKVYKAVIKLREDGLINKIGISAYSAEELQSLVSNFDFDIVQVPFNFFDRRLSDSGWLDKLYGMGIEVHVRSVFLQGLLLMPPSNRPAKFAKWDKVWERYNNWLLENELTALQACINFVLDNPLISRAIVGIDSLENIQQIIAAVDKTLPPIPEYLECKETNLIDPRTW